MMVGLRDYVERNRFPGVVLGLSGGIDSAICAAVAADALGADKVWCVMLPSRFTGDESLDDARACDDMIGCRTDTTARSEERSVGKEGVSTCRIRWSPCQ